MRKFVVNFIYTFVFFISFVSVSDAGVLDWTPDPEDDPCELITAPDDPEDPGWLMWRAALCGDGLPAMLPPIRKLGGIPVKNDPEAYDLIRRAWPEHKIPTPAIPLPSSFWFLFTMMVLGSIFSSGVRKWK